MCHLTSLCFFPPTPRYYWCVAWINNVHYPSINLILHTCSNLLYTILYVFFLEPIIALPTLFVMINSYWIPLAQLPILNPHIKLLFKCIFYCEYTILYANSICVPAVFGCSNSRAAFKSQSIWTISAEVNEYTVSFWIHGKYWCKSHFGVECLGVWTSCHYVSLFDNEVWICVWLCITLYFYNDKPVGNLFLFL